MSAQLIQENVQAKEILASLKSGVPIMGTVRSRDAHASTHAAWIAIQLPELGERQVSVPNQPDLRPGQQVILQCLPDPLNPEHYSFRVMASGSVAGKYGAPHCFARTYRFRRVRA